MPRSPWATRIRRAGIIAERTRQSGADAARIVAQASASSRSSAAAPGVGPRKRCAGMPRRQAAPRSARPGSLGLPSPSSVRRAPARRQAPERHPGVDLEHPRGNFRIGAHRRVDIAIFGAIMDAAWRPARRVGRRGRRRQAPVVVAAIAARRNRDAEDAAAEQRPQASSGPRPPGPARAGRPIGMSTATITGRRRREDAGKECLDPDADFISEGRTKAASQPWRQQSAPASQHADDIDSLTARPSAARS